MHMLNPDVYLGASVLRNEYAAMIPPTRKELHKLFVAIRQVQMGTYRCRSQFASP